MLSETADESLSDLNFLFLILGKNHYHQISFRSTFLGGVRKVSKDTRPNPERDL
jgi:hypothetical protein